MRDGYEEIKKRGLRVVVIGNGEPEHAKAFQEEEAIPFDLWVDPDMVAYKAAGLRRSLTQTLSIRSVGHAWRALRRGYRQSKVRGDPWQLGGVFLFTVDGQCLYQQKSAEAGDHPSMAELLQALDRHVAE